VNFVLYVFCIPVYNFPNSNLSIFYRQHLFIIILCDYKGRFHHHFMCSFYVCRSQKHKKYSQVIGHFELLGSTWVKAFSKTLMKLTTGVNFINIKRTYFLYEKNLYEKRWWNWLQVSISSTLNAHIFCTKKICTKIVDEID